MKKWAARLALLALPVGAAFVVGVLVGRARGIPFVTQGEQWTIGIYSGDSPFELSSSFWTMNPVLTSFDVTDAPARFVADPFLFRDGSSWYLFFEVYSWASDQGELAVATGDGGRNWEYQQIVLDEPFHLSYPYVFESEGERYLIPESFEAESIRLYRANDFPTGWEFVTTLVEGVYVDPSVAHFNGRWWMFAATPTNDSLHLFHAEELEGPWQEHAMSPIVRGDAHKARPSGRVLVHDGRLYRFTMDVEPPVGTHQVFAYEVTTLTTEEYAESLISDGPVVAAHGSGWTEQGMHQVDAHRLDDGRWIAAVDGFGPFYVFGLRH